MSSKEEEEEEAITVDARPPALRTHGLRLTAVPCRLLARDSRSASQ